MTKDEFIKGKEDFILEITPNSKPFDIKAIREGQEGWRNKLTIENNPYDGRPIIDGKPVTIDERYESWDFGWRIEDYSTYALLNYDYLNHDNFKKVMMSSDLEC